MSLTHHFKENSERLAALYLCHQSTLFDITIIVILSHPLTEADLESVRALGGTITFAYQTLPCYGARVSDRVVPAIRPLAGVKSLEADGIDCLF